MREIERWCTDQLFLYIMKIYFKKIKKEKEENDH